MSDDANPEINTRREWSTWAIAGVSLLLVLFTVVSLGTLRGCFFNSSQQADEDGEKKKKEAEKKNDKPPFELGTPVILPSEGEAPSPPVKPGHWATASQRMRANLRDFVGDSTLSIVDNTNRPQPVTSTPFYIRASRKVLLTKGRRKATESTFFVPPVARPLTMVLNLEESGLGAGPSQSAAKLKAMPAYQYHFVVLAKTPSRYAFIKTLDSVNVPYAGEAENETIDDNPDLHYRIVMLGADQIASLPDSPLTWTSIAYMLWDDIDPGEPFPAEQKKALVDWLHWGGQLIVSGPDSLDRLKGSFLDSYLPATSGGVRKFSRDDQDIVPFSNYWTISHPPAAPGVPLRLTVPWSGIKLDLRPRAKEMPNAAGLFVERQVGRGRVVVSAFRLAERDFINWRSGFESFFNSCLLRRPTRRYSADKFGNVTLNWDDDSLKERRLDASLNTRLYYFARDLGVATAYHYEPADDNGVPQTGPGSAPVPQPMAPNQSAREYRPPDNVGGAGAWNDFSETANAARVALREAAGVDVPGAGFVVFCLAAYLIALVPLNWLIFRTIGRIEWAWLAAPVIAIVGTWVIVQRARLDIGFVRAQTEISVLEQQPEHPRAHLSRYTALYTSLSTTYDFEYANMTTLIAPFPSRPNFELVAGESLTPVDFQRYDKVRLSGLPISSNSTGMVHSEQMISLDGPIRVAPTIATGQDQIENHSNMELRSVCIVKRNGSELDGDWIADLLPGQSAPLVMKPLPSSNLPLAENRAAEMRSVSGDRLNLEPLFRLALDPKNIDDGETRLVARIDEVFPGESISPVASQVRGATLVVAHLRYAPLSRPTKDANTRQDIKTAREKDQPGPIEL
jgi:hypothetical protein